MDREKDLQIRKDHFATLEAVESALEAIEAVAKDTGSSIILGLEQPEGILAFQSAARDLNSAVSKAGEELNERQLGKISALLCDGGSFLYLEEKLSEKTEIVLDYTDSDSISIIVKIKHDPCNPNTTTP